MSIAILCPTCATRLTLTDDRAGTPFTCPRCDAKMMVPGTAPSPAFTPTAYVAPPLREEEDDEDRKPARRSRRNRDEDNDDDEDERRPVSRGRGFECPYCGSQRAPIVKTQISQTGWIVFALLLIFTVCLCFIGLFITEETRHCRDCGMKLS